MTAALEIKPGKYRTRGGQVAKVTRAAITLGCVGYDWDVQRDGCQNYVVTPAGRYWSEFLRPDAPESVFDIIERIEDEPKAEEKCRPKFSYAARFIDAAEWPDKVFGEVMVNTSVGAVPVKGSIIAATERRNVGDGDFISVDLRSHVEALKAKIARLEAENESLSRQLRSRELNKEPASAGKVWRWSPMV